MVYLFGAGHVGRALVPVLTGVEFPVVVYDERPEAVRPEDFPTALAVVRQVLAWGPSYVGCMGSRKKRAFLRFAPEQIDTVHLPIGLEIGARTPAELIAHRAALRGGGSGLCPA